MLVYEECELPVTREIEEKPKHLFPFLLIYLPLTQCCFIVILSLCNLNIFRLCNKPYIIFSMLEEFLLRFSPQLIYTFVFAYAKSFPPGTIYIVISHDVAQMLFVP